MQIITLVIFSLLFHPVHYSMSSITQEKNSDTINVFVRLYYDDFLLDYKIDGDRTDLPGTDGLFSDENVSNYLNSRINIIVNNKLLKSKLINQVYRKPENELSLTFFCISEEKPLEVEVINKLIIKVHADQENMTIIKFGDLEKGVKFSSLQTGKKFSISKTAP